MFNASICAREQKSNMICSFFSIIFWEYTIDTNSQADDNGFAVALNHRSMGEYEERAPRIRNDWFRKMSDEFLFCLEIFSYFWRLKRNSMHVIMSLKEFEMDFAYWVQSNWRQKLTKKSVSQQYNAHLACRSRHKKNEKKKKNNSHPKASQQMMFFFVFISKIMTKNRRSRENMKESRKIHVIDNTPLIYYKIEFNGNNRCKNKSSFICIIFLCIVCVYVLFPIRNIIIYANEMGFCRSPTIISSVFLLVRCRFFLRCTLSFD